MKNTFEIILLLLATGFCTLGCTQDTSLLDQAPDNLAIDVKTYGDLEFVYQVTDMEGNPQNTFSEGENFMFSFVVKNYGETDISLGSWTYIPGIDDFFALYRKGDEGGKEQRIGKSYRFSANFKDLKPQIVPGKGKIEYRIPWLTDYDTNYVMPTYEQKEDVLKRNYRSVEPLNTSLSPGEYYSGFTLERQDEEISFAITFVVK